MSFFNNFLDLTLLQHLIAYWYVWGAIAITSFVILFVINKKEP